MGLDHGKLSIAEAASNDDGKTSGNKLLALWFGLIAGLMLIAGIIAFFSMKDQALINSGSMIMAGSSAFMLGKEFISKKYSNNEKTDPPTPAAAELQQ